MCGIAGLFSARGPVEEAVVRSMQESMIHRGPDGEGFFSRAGLAMGMRRLAIIDREGGSQPVHNEACDVAVVYNGEIYNHRELQRELEAKGHTFRSYVDTEVIVHLYEEEGPDFVKRLDGMFAFSLWDEKRKTLLLARDRFGVKPLFIAGDGERLAWASELNALLCDPSIPRDLDWEAMEVYLALYYIPSPRTIYRAIRCLPPAHVMILGDGRVETRRYWSPRFGGCALEGEELCEAIRERLAKAVKGTLESEVPLGVFLSGGLDSTAIAGFATEALGRLRTFTLGFDAERSYDERPLAESVAKRYGTEHVPIVLKPSEVAPILENLVGVYGQPFGDWSAVVNYRIAEEAARTTTVILRGDGGDELFGGYPTLVASRFVSRYLALPAPLRHAARQIVESLPASEKYMSLDFKLKRFVAGIREPVEAAHLGWKEIFSREERVRICPGVRTNEGEIFRSISAPLLDEVRGEELLDRLMYIDLRVFLEGCGLITSDHVAMAHTIETRVPFLTNEIADFALSIPARWKVKGLTTKHIFRRAMTRILPRELLAAPKRGFVMPGASWLKGPLRDFVEENLLEAPAWIDRDAARAVWNAHLSGGKDATRPMSALVNLILWSRKGTL